jgi:hypothetical protein
LKTPVAANQGNQFAVWLEFEFFNRGLRRRRGISVPVAVAVDRRTDGRVVFSRGYQAFLLVRINWLAGSVSERC